MYRNPVLLYKTLVIGIILLFVGMSINPSTGTTVEKVSSAEIGSPGYIQDLIDNASEGDKIYIPSGIYYENIIINKSISLIGEDKDTTIIDGNRNGDVVFIATDNVNISRFTIRNGSNGICIDSNYITITDNNITNNVNGIALHQSSYNIIKSNIVKSNKENGIDIAFSSNNNTCWNNQVYQNSGVGIYIHFSKGNIISSNKIYRSNRYSSQKWFL